MARNIPKKGDSQMPPPEAHEESKDEARPDEAQDPVPGGALGILPDAERTISTGGHNIVGSAKRASGHPLVMYESAVTRLHVGKVYGENEVDLDMLRSQGVQFEEIPAAPEATPEAE